MSILDLNPKSLWSNIDLDFSEMYGEEKLGVGGRSLSVLLAVRGRRPWVVMEDALSRFSLGLEVPFIVDWDIESLSRCGGDDVSLEGISSLVFVSTFELRIVPASDPGLRTVPLSETSSSFTPARFGVGESRSDLIEAAVCSEQVEDSVESLSS